MKNINIVKLKVVNRTKAFELTLFSHNLNTYNVKASGILLLSGTIFFHEISGKLTFLML